MSWRNVIISNPARLSLKHGHLVVKQEEAAEIPLEDIAVIIVASERTVFTAALLCELAERGVPLFTCGEGHLPCGVFLPYQRHSRFLKVLKCQMEQTLPFRKNCWKAVVKQKIKNQALCLDMLGKRGGAELRALASEVKSGDPDNRESAAARIYFDSYMPDTTRQEDNAVNAALNYGYVIMRGAVARSLTSYGFLCAVGIHHRNELNAFNLADDFMEVLRPVVDLWTARNVTNGSAFTIKERAELAALLGAPVVINFERQKILRAIDIMCASFSTASAAGDASALKLPELAEP